LHPLQDGDKDGSRPNHASKKTNQHALYDRASSSSLDARGHSDQRPSHYITNNRDITAIHEYLLQDANSSYILLHKKNKAKERDLYFKNLAQLIGDLLGSSPAEHAV
jgi:hypothetical protein